MLPVALPRLGLQGGCQPAARHRPGHAGHGSIVLDRWYARIRPGFKQLSPLARAGSPYSAASPRKGLFGCCFQVSGGAEASP